MVASSVNGSALAKPFTSGKNAPPNHYFLAIVARLRRILKPEFASFQSVPYNRFEAIKKGLGPFECSRAPASLLCLSPQKQQPRSSAKFSYRATNSNSRRSTYPAQNTFPPMDPARLHLPYSRDSRHGFHPAALFFRVARILAGQARTRPDHAHVARKHAEELRQLVQTVTPQSPSQARHPRIIRHLE